MKESIFALLALFIISCSPKTDKIASANIFTYWVDSTKVPCTGLVPQQCLRVKKGDSPSVGEWAYFYSSIDGFDYEPGYTYQLRVKETHRSAAETPADGSSVLYTLVEVVEKKPDTKLRLYDIWALEAIRGKDIDHSIQQAGIKHPTIEFNLTEMRVMGTDGCNNFSGTINSVTGSELQLSPLMSTEMACQNMTIPDQVNQSLNAVTAYQIKGLKLHLMDKSGAALLRYRKVD